MRQVIPAAIRLRPPFVSHGGMQMVDIDVTPEAWAKKPSRDHLENPTIGHALSWTLGVGPRRHGDRRPDRPDRPGQLPDRGTVRLHRARSCWGRRSRSSCPSGSGRAPEAPPRVLHRAASAADGMRARELYRPAQGRQRVSRGDQPQPPGDRRRGPGQQRHPRRHRAQASTRSLRQRTDELEAANKELEAFSYSVSHDLRPPCGRSTASRASCSKNTPNSCPTTPRSYLKSVRANTQQMGRLVDDLLAFARLGRQPIKKQTVDPAKLVQQCLDELRGEQDGRHVEIIMGDLPPCDAEPALLKQVWINLLSNAIKYTRGRELATIEVGCRRDGGPSG